MFQDDISSNNELAIFENFCLRGKRGKADYSHVFKRRACWVSWDDQFSEAEHLYKLRDLFDGRSVCRSVCRSIGVQIAFVVVFNEFHTTNTVV